MIMIDSHPMLPVIAATDGTATTLEVEHHVVFGARDPVELLELRVASNLPKTLRITTSSGLVLLPTPLRQPFRVALVPMVAISLRCALTRCSFWVVDQPGVTTRDVVLLL